MRDRGVGGDQCRGRTRFIFIQLVGERGDTSHRVEGEIMLEYGEGKRGGLGGGDSERERGATDQGWRKERKRGYLFVLNYNRGGEGARSSQ